MEKSFGEMITDSFTAFKKSFLASLGVAGIFLGVFFVFGVIFALMFGKQIFNGGVSNPQALLAYIPVLILLFITIVFIQYVSFAWIVLIIRNNILAGRSFFKESFFEAVRKIFKIILFGILLLFVFGVIFFVCYLIAPRIFPLLMLPLGLVLLPVILTTSYGILCLEGGFWDILSESVSLGFSRWFKIIWYIICFGFCYVVLLLGITYGIANVFKAINMNIIGSFITVVIQLCFTLFSYCFYTVFYLDLAGIEPRQKIEIKEEQIILDDTPLNHGQDLGQNLTANIEERPMRSEDENNEPPHMNILK